MLQFEDFLLWVRKSINRFNSQELLFFFGLVIIQQTAEERKRILRGFKLAGTLCAAISIAKSLIGTQALIYVY